jgi:hypothetical protein
MKVSELVEKSGWKNCSTNESLDKEIQGVYVGDLLSWVMGRGQPDEAWITVQSHLNIIAVAVLREFSCIIIADCIEIPEEVINKAKEENIALISASGTAFDCAKKCIEFGL